MYSNGKAVVKLFTTSWPFYVCRSTMEVDWSPLVICKQAQPPAVCPAARCQGVSLMPWAWFTPRWPKGMMCNFVSSVFSEITGISNNTHTHTSKILKYFRSTVINSVTGINSFVAVLDYTVMTWGQNTDRLQIKHTLLTHKLLIEPL